MSGRLANHWTDSLAQAYGESGERGRAAELLVMDILKRNGIDFVEYESDYQQQVAGIDLISNGLSIDVKGNFYKGHFYIENGPAGWLFSPNKKSDIILHIDPSTEEIVWYYRMQAKQIVRQVPDEYGPPWGKGAKSIVEITSSKIDSRKDVMSRDWEALFKLLRKG